MKRLILFTILIGLAVMSYGQRRNPDGFGVGPKATWTTDGYIKRIRVDAVNNTVTLYDAVGDSLQLNSPNQLNLSEVAPLLVDTIPFSGFGIASFQPADTAAFNDDAWAGSWCNTSSDTLVTTIAVTALGAGSGTETLGYNICVSDTCGAINPTKFFDTDETTTAVIPTKGDIVTSFDNFKIAPYQWVWVPISGVSAGNRPSYFTLTIGGYKIRTY